MEPGDVRERFRGKLIRVEVETWPDGRWEVVRHPGAAAVLPITPDGDVMLVRQFRKPVRRTLLEIPAGVLDRPHEDAAACAARELFEETGYRHETLDPLGGVYTSAGFSDEYVHLFVATTRAEPEGEPEPEIELVREPFREMVRAARAGRVSDAKTALALLLADERRACP